MLASGRATLLLAGDIPYHFCWYALKTGPHYEDTDPGVALEDLLASFTPHRSRIPYASIVYVNLNIIITRATRTHISRTLGSHPVNGTLGHHPKYDYDHHPKPETNQPQV